MSVGGVICGGKAWFLGSRLILTMALKAEGAKIADPASIVSLVNVETDERERVFFDRAVISCGIFWLPLPEGLVSVLVGVVIDGAVFIDFFLH